MIPGVVVVEVGEDVLAYVVRASVREAESGFLTDDSAPFQLGFIHHPEGHEIVPHRHLPVRREIVGTAEVVLVRSGRVKVRLFDGADEEVHRLILDAGDLILHLRGGHSFEMLEETTLLEIKQGPYAGSEDKEPIP